jgi:hypothetical protein
MASNLPVVLAVLAHHGGTLPAVIALAMDTNSETLGDRPVEHYDQSGVAPELEAWLRASSPGTFELCTVGRTRSSSTLHIYKVMWP